VTTERKVTIKVYTCAYMSYGMSTPYFFASCQKIHLNWDNVIIMFWYFPAFFFVLHFCICFCYIICYFHFFG